MGSELANHRTPRVALEHSRSFGFMMTFFSPLCLMYPARSASSWCKAATCRTASASSCAGFTICYAPTNSLLIYMHMRKPGYIVLTLLSVLALVLDFPGTTCAASTFTDSDQDGVSNARDSKPYDHDNDGITDGQDRDDDDDGRLDVPEFLKFRLDHDNDAVKDVADTDDDNDGTLDTKERTKQFDHDNDGLGDKADVDDDEDGINDLNEDEGEEWDHDNDGSVDVDDEDDDNDGINDDSDQYNFDSNNDGISDDIS